MKILFVVPYVPNLIRTRPYNLIRGLSARGHRVTVLTLWSNDSERADAEQLKAYCEKVVALPMPRWRSLSNCLQSLPGATPLQSSYCWQPELLPTLEAEALQADVVHVEHLRGARYGLHLKAWAARGGRRLPVVWDSVDCISLLFRQAAQHSRSPFGRWVTRFELGRTERYEAWLVRQFDRVLVTSQADRDALLSLPAGGNGRTPKITILPNGVDVDYFAPNGLVREPATIVFSGKMSYHANITMALHLAQGIMPHVWARRPEARLQIVGKDPSRDVLNLGQIPSVTVTGTVEDLRPYLHRATVAAVPLVYGAGVQNKLLEAMASATPVTASPQAAAPYQAQPDQDLLVAQEPARFADAMLSLMADPERRQAIGQAGRRYVETNHRWDQLVIRAEDSYNEVIHPHG